jgi:deazaflavin-dependent oxidoreductase (nitroreductase family)
MADASEERRKEVEERAARNVPVIEEYRATGGQLSGPMAGFEVVLVHHKGAKSGVERVNPVAYRRVGDDIAVFASNAGRKSNPDWYYNLVAHPETVVELGAETLPVRARVASGEERTEIWEAQKAGAPMFADYEITAAPREIPVVILERS